MRDWLPKTNRNRLALGFAAVALVMFVVWNLMPFYPTKGQPSEGLVVTEFWPTFFDPDYYLRVFKTPDVHGFMEIAAVAASFMNAWVVLAAVPFWRIFHASNHLKIPVAVVNVLGGGVILWFTCDMGTEHAPPFSLVILTLMTSTMFCLSTAMLLFENELDLRHDMEVKKMIGG